MAFKVGGVQFKFLRTEEDVIVGFFQKFNELIGKYASNTEYSVKEKTIEFSKPISANTLNNILAKLENDSNYQIARVDYYYMLDTTSVEVR